MRDRFIKYIVIAWIIVILVGALWPGLMWLSLILLAITLVGIYDMNQTKHALWRTFPVVGRGRWVMEFVRPFLRQYFFESETDGVPINRMFRSVIYQRAKGDRDTIPYGTKVNTQRIGYEWIGHSMSAIHLDKDALMPRVKIGGPDFKSLLFQYFQCVRHELRRSE